MSLAGSEASSRAADPWSEAGEAPRVARSAELEARSVRKDYGGLRAVADISFRVCGGEILGIVGPNGAGKTTLFDVITGLTKATCGDVLFDGASIIATSVHRRCRLGLARTFQQPTVAGTLTVYENVLLGSYFGQPRVHWQGVADSPETYAEQLLDFVNLANKRNWLADPLGLLDKKRLMLGSALATGPRVLLLDEPFGGLNTHEIGVTLELLWRIRDLGVAVVCIEHVMRALTRLADRVLVMHHGRALFQGTPQDMVGDQTVIDVYLGTQGVPRPPV